MVGACFDFLWQAWTACVALPPSIHADEFRSHPDHDPGKLEHVKSTLTIPYNDGKGGGGGGWGRYSREYKEGQGIQIFQFSIFINS